VIWIFIAIGGAAGALARYAVAGRVARRTGGAFPWGTLAVNTLGAFLLGVVLMAIEGSPRRLEVVALVAVGFLGDFTTFSTYAYEATTQLRERRWGRAIAYVLGSVCLGLLAFVAGAALGARAH
jgi:fluoride exporter